MDHHYCHMFIFWPITGGYQPVCVDCGNTRSDIPVEGVVADHI